MIVINIDKAKEIAHAERRRRRSSEFGPLDAQIASQIPGIDLRAVEAARAGVRARYAAMQSAIDAATTPDAIKRAAEM